MQQQKSTGIFQEGFCSIYRAINARDVSLQRVRFFWLKLWSYSQYVLTLSWAVLVNYGVFHMKCWLLLGTAALYIPTIHAHHIDAAVRAINQHPTEHAEQCKLAMGSYSPQNLRSPNPKWFWQICHLFIGYFTIYTNSTGLEINISFSNIYYLLDVDSTDELLEYSSEPKLLSRMDAAHTHTHTRVYTHADSGCSVSPVGILLWAPLLHLSMATCNGREFGEVPKWALVQTVCLVLIRHF